MRTTKRTLADLLHLPPRNKLGGRALVQAPEMRRFALLTDISIGCDA